MSMSHDLSTISSVGSYSSHLKKKVQLPRHASLEAHETLLSGDLMVRTHNGFVWNSYKTKSCILLKSGVLFIYSKEDQGLSIHLKEVSAMKHVFTPLKSTTSETLVKCEFALQKGSKKIGLLVRGSRSLVSRWRKGIVSGYDGLSLVDPADDDEETWCELYPASSGTEDDFKRGKYGTLPPSKPRIPMTNTNVHSLDRSRQFAASFCVQSVGNDCNTIMEEAIIGDVQHNRSMFNMVTSREDVDSGVSSPSEPGYIKSKSTSQEQLSMDGELEMENAVAGENLLNVSTCPEDVADVCNDVASDPEGDLPRPSTSRSPQKIVSRLEGIPMLSTDILQMDKVLYFNERVPQFIRF